MASLLDRCMFVPTSGGTGTWTVSAAVTGYMTPAQAGAVNATTYYYAAESSDKSQWEVGKGTYTVSGTTLARTTVIYSSNSNAAVNFTNPPNVLITLLAENTATATEYGLALIPGIVGPLEQHTASSSASLDFTTAITSAYDEYLIEFASIVPATNAVNLYMRMSTNGGSSYDSSGIYSYAVLGANRFGSATTGNDGTATQIQLNQSTIVNTSTASIAGFVRLYSPGSTSLHKRIKGEIGIVSNSGSPFDETDSMTGAYRSTTAVNAFQFLFSSGNIASGTIRVYGIGK